MEHIICTCFKRLRQKNAAKARKGKNGKTTPLVCQKAAECILEYRKIVKTFLKILIDQKGVKRKQEKERKKKIPIS